MSCSFLPSLPVKSLKELIEYAKANPGKLNFGSGGIGTSNHLASELFKTLAKVSIVHVPYKGSNQAMIAMMGGEVGMVVIGLPSSQAQIQAGKVRALAVLSEQRLPSLPDVPTAREAGMDNFEVTTWYGILAPAGTPRDIVTRLNAEWGKITAMPDTKEKMQKRRIRADVEHTRTVRRIRQNRDRALGKSHQGRQHEYRVAGT